VESLGAFVQVVGRMAADGLRDLEWSRVETKAGDRFTRADSEWGYLMGTRLPNLRKRHQLRQAVRKFFDAAGLLEVDTPAIVPCPGLDVHLDAVAIATQAAEAPRWLHTSPEYQMKRLLTTGLPGIYQLGKAFRRGELGRLHEPEFTMLEWYRTFCDAEPVMQDTEQLVAAAALELTGGLIIPGVEGPVDVTPPWDRLSVEAAFERFTSRRLAEVLSDETEYFQLLADEIEPKLGRGRPVFLTDYPARMASLARLSPKNPMFAERFEAYIDGVELCNGFGELVDPVEQRQRFDADRQERTRLGRVVYPIDERFVAALEEGIPPSGGNALGFDRLLMLLVGARHIDEVVTVPSLRL
jgi:lysyl-tRNA synthetase class 2